MGLFSNMKAKAKQKEHDKIIGLKEKAEKGDQKAQFELAQYYSSISDLEFMKSEELEIDDKKAYELFCFAAQRESANKPYSDWRSAESAYYAAVHIMEGKGVKKNDIKAISIFRDLICRSKNGEYITKEKACRKKLLELRKELDEKLKKNSNDADAMYCLAHLLYFFPSDVIIPWAENMEQLEQKAFSFCQQARALGNKDADFLGIQMKMNGCIDIKTAKMFAELGSPVALDLMAQNLVKVQQDYKKGIEYAEDYLKHGVDVCLNYESVKFILGFAYYMIDEYEKAEAMFGDTIIRKPDVNYCLDIESESYVFLGCIYENGKSGSYEDKVKALSYYEKAMQLGSSRGKEKYEALLRS